MGPTGTRRLYEPALSREWARARIEEDEAKKYRRTGSVSSNHSARKETPAGQSMGRSIQGSLDETND